jgi:DNA-binding response OmpR family regulator
MLVVEKNDLVRESIASMVKALGHMVFEAASTELAMSALAMFRVDVLMTSRGFSATLDGVELARYTRFVSPATTLVLSAGSVKEEAEVLHVDEYLQKPFTLDTLRNVIARDRTLFSCSQRLSEERNATLLFIWQQARPDADRPRQIRKQPASFHPEVL